MDDATVEAIAAEPIGWLYRPYGHAIWAHTPVEQDWDDLSRHGTTYEHVAIFRQSAAALPDPRPTEAEALLRRSRSALRLPFASDRDRMRPLVSADIDAFLAAAGDPDA